MSLLLDLLHGAGLGVRYWGDFLFGHVGLELGSFGKHSVFRPHSGISRGFLVWGFVLGSSKELVLESWKFHFLRITVEFPPIAL